ncbi:putative 26S proteasome regulatory subunit [Trapelia coarctata]|nr:putative 26S proteasome regulatory subunit [Trapelia coarctata]
MEDLHTPTVPSGPVTGVGGPGAAHDEQTPLTDLISEKERVESELTALSSVLDSHGVNMQTSLTTFDGYPRDDLDIAQIRTTRARIIRLRNDYKGLMSRIEAGLHVHHAAAAAQASSSVLPTAGLPLASSGHSNSPETLGVPFARVNSVVSGSPADDAGLRVGDCIRQFGSVNWLNHEKLSKVAETVQRNQGRSIVVKVLRGDTAAGTSEELQLNLTPRRDWGGRGLLGCHLLPA